MRTRRTADLRRLSFLPLLMAGAAYGAESDYPVTAFRFVDFDGSIELRYLFDDRDNSLAGVATTFEEQTSIETMLDLNSRSYVYHPDFLDLSLGIGAQLVTQDFAAITDTVNSDEALLNFDASLALLKSSPYPSRLFFSRSHPSVSTSLSGSFLVETDQVGLSASVLEPVSPVQVNLEALRTRNSGSGLGAVLDDQVDDVGLRIFRSYRDTDRIGIAYRWNRRDSLSGSTGLPISQATIRTRTLSLDGRNVFGDGGNAVLIQRLDLLEQDTVAATPGSAETTSYLADLNWRHTRATRSFYTYRHGESRRNARSNTTLDALSVGVARDFGDTLRTSAAVDVERNEDIAFLRDRSAVRGSINYSRPISAGVLSLGAGLSAQRIDREAGSDVIAVIDENLVLSGTTPVDLKLDFVIGTSVVVTNADRTQTFVEGSDYRLITIGSTTSLQRIVGGNIADGQAVLVSYDYQSGGTAAFDVFDQSYVAELRFLRYFGVYARFSDHDVRLRSGLPTTPLNGIQNVEFGVSADVPTGDRLQIGGEIRLTEQTEDIASFSRESYDAYVQASLPLSMFVVANWHREFVDNEGSPEDVDLTQYRVQLRGSPFRNLRASLMAERLEDTGGTILRRRDLIDLSVDFGYRRVRFVLRARDVSESLGATTQDYAQIQAQIIRTFQ